MYPITAMRIFITGLTIIATSAITMAQLPSTSSGDNASLNSNTPSRIESASAGVKASAGAVNEAPIPNGIMLIGTTMMIVKNGVSTPLEKDVVFSNGTRVRKDGYVIRKNKHKLLLNFDEYVDASGKILPITKTSSFINPY